MPGMFAESLKSTKGGPQVKKVAATALYLTIAIFPLFLVILIDNIDCLRHFYPVLYCADYYIVPSTNLSDLAFTVPTTSSRPSIEMVLLFITVRLLVVDPVLKWLPLLLLCRLLVLGPILKWYLYLCMYVCIYPCSLSWTHRFIFYAQISYVGLLKLSNVHLGIRFLICHIVSPWWHMGGCQGRIFGGAKNC